MTLGRCDLRSGAARCAEKGGRAISGLIEVFFSFFNSKVVAVERGSASGVHGREFPELSELARLRAWYSGLTARAAVVQYLGQRKATGQSSRAMLAAIRHRLIRHAQDRHRGDLAEVFSHPAEERQKREAVVRRAIEVLQQLPLPAPLLTHGVEQWYSSRGANALKNAGIETLADLILRIPRRRRWWAVIPGLGVGSAQRIESFFAEHPELTQRARALVAIPAARTSPWETLVVPEDVNGSRGVFRAPQATCTLSATDDYKAVQAWLELQDAQATQRAYRKEAERLMLWAILQRGKALSSLTTEDAIAYRAFLRNPSPRERWVGPVRPWTSGEWRPSQGALAPRSVGYALSRRGRAVSVAHRAALCLGQPLCGIKVKGRVEVRRSTCPMFSSNTSGR